MNIHFQTIVTSVMFSIVTSKPSKTCSTKESLVVVIAKLQYTKLQYTKLQYTKLQYTIFTVYKIYSIQSYSIQSYSIQSYSIQNPGGYDTYVQAHIILARIFTV